LKISNYTYGDWTKLSATADLEVANGSAYKQMVGNLIHLTTTTQVLTFVVDYIPRFLTAPKADHWMATKRNLRYANGLLEVCIMYRREEDLDSSVTWIQIRQLQLITGSPP